MNTPIKPTHYVGLFYLPKPQREHAQLVPALKTVASDVKVIPMGGNCLMVLLASTTAPHNFPLGGIRHTGDQVAWFEIGEYTTAREFGTVQGWLDSHRPRH
jgi:hypothetical protein